MVSELRRSVLAGGRGPNISRLMGDRVGQVRFWEESDGCSSCLSRSNDPGSGCSSPQQQSEKQHWAFLRLVGTGTTRECRGTKVLVAVTKQPANGKQSCPARKASDSMDSTKQRCTLHTSPLRWASTLRTAPAMPAAPAAAPAQRSKCPWSPVGLVTLNLQSNLFRPRGFQRDPVQEVRSECTCSVVRLLLVL